MIEHIHLSPYHLPYAAPFATSRGASDAREGVIVRLLAGGHEGLGEAAPVPGWGQGDAADALRLLEALAPRLAGRTLDEADALLAGLDRRQPGALAAACALDTALLDLRARAAGVPLWALLARGERQKAHAGWISDDDVRNRDALRSAFIAGRRPIPVNATIGAAETAAACAAARRAVADGFGCIKLKVGMAGSPTAELARIAAVREAIGPGVALRLDANGAWTPEAALAILRDAARYGIEYCEQPVSAGDVAGMARVRAGAGVPLAADEALAGPEDALRIAAAAAADVLIVKPMTAGGLRPALDVIAIARAAGLRAVVTTTIDSGVGCAAALHLAAALPAPRPHCGLATGRLLAGDLLARPLRIEHGAMPLPAGPGLGVELAERWPAR
jgi:L-alanine-DL-glutamate epimerase-like enolase superfamily enzyme